MVGGSEGWTEYEVKVGDCVERFRLKFDDPASIWSKNKLESWSSNNNRLRVDVKPYNTSGHPFNAHVEISSNPSALAEADAKPCPAFPVAQYKQQRVMAENVGKVHADYEIGFDWPGPGLKRPIHENIAIAAFIRSNLIFPKALTYNNINHKQWEYFRGMIWNDDPSCLLFNRSVDDNRSFGKGVDWYREFKVGDKNGMTQRSHFGNLQFLHSMGCSEGEQPQDTRDRILKWLGIMYKLACGGQGVKELDPVGNHFPEHFNNKTDPSKGTTMRDLITASTPEYKAVEISKRALGVCMHAIQDSFAIGHVQRRLLNPWDVAGRSSWYNYVYFKPGTTGRWGPILSFHTYGSQDSDRHSFYDGVEDGDMPDPRNLDSFNHLNGARDAIEACLMLINAFADKKPWEEVRAALVETVFRLDKDARPCNSGVDEKIPGYDAAFVPAAAGEPDTASSGDMSAAEYQAGLVQKLSAMEAGLLARPVTAPQCLCARLRVLQVAAYACILVLVLVLGFASLSR